MNGLTDELCNSYAGCYINDKCINHIIYADDICLMAPTGTQCRICLMSATIMELQMIFYLVLLNLSVLYINRNITNYFVLR